MVVGELGALLTIEIVPVTLPPAVGANWAVKDAVFPAPSVIGVASPLILKPVPDAEACVIVRLAPPLLVSVTVWLPVLPVATEPKVTDEGLAPSCPWVPMPAKAIVVGEFGALLVIEIVPCRLPAVVGANCAA